jgi:tRNA pseudouridine55 synthase
MTENIFDNQILSVNKPLNWTSFDVVKKLKYKMKVKKIGHAGTLDPLASGVLIVCTGKMTKQISKIQEMQKEYKALFCLGATTSSLDTEFVPEDFEDTSHISRDRIEEVIKNQFLGTIEQKPPLFSAIKINGQRAYKIARKGGKEEEVEIKPKEVTIYDLEIKEVFSKKAIQINPDTASEASLSCFEAVIKCSKGTYIRSLARDIAFSLGTKGYLLSLERTAIGDYRIEDSKKIEELTV